MTIKRAKKMVYEINEMYVSGKFDGKDWYGIVQTMYDLIPNDIDFKEFEKEVEFMNSLLQLVAIGRATERDDNSIEFH